MERKPVGIFRTHPDAILPTTAYANDVGYDLYAVEEYEIPFGEMVEVKVGICLSLPPDMFVQINTRSSFGKRGMMVHHGVIDPGYTGELTLWIFNLAATRDVNGVTKRSAYTIKKGDKVGQLLFHDAKHPALVEINELPTTERGDNGYGSSGK